MPLPNSLPWMESADAKLVRAREHLDSLQQEMHAFVDSAERTLVLKTDQAETHAWMVHWVSDPYPPIRLSVLIGDCAFNMRSALDNLVCGLVRKADPPSACIRTQFPIYRLDKQWKEHSERDLRGVPADARAVIKSLQPFNRPEQTIPLDPLFILNELCNRDKHRALILTTGYSRNTRFAIHLNDGSVLYITLDRPLYSDSPETIPLDIDPTKIRGGARVQAMGTSVIAFRDDDPWSDRPVLDVLANCLRYVEDRVVGSLKPFFSSSTS